MPANANPAKKTQKSKKVVNLAKKTIEEAIPVTDYDPEELTFALDIGTRTVVGIVGVQEEENFKVLAAEVVEHKNRAMLDGQIHDINQVASVAREVKEKLEGKLGISLTKVAIAAAGRVLKTCQVTVEREIEQGRELDQELVSGIEVEGIQLAQMKLDEELSKEDKTQFYCVGYSVINYYLNGYVISSLLGHKGKKIGADILATFLPHIVVDSLYTVMSKIGLEVVSLTLEPIAAINVTIPKDLRLLNLALVDIGAGTSDIALTRDGTVVAYAMAPTAGDEITERIAQHYLVDFNTGESIKIMLSSAKESVSFVDILGKKHTIKKEELLEVIKPSVELLAATISEKILEYNHKAPNAVFLIGGGSQVPGLTDLIADYLKMSRERVVVRGREMIQNIKYSGKKLSGPEAITPFGIAVTAQMQKGQDFLSVVINGKKIRLFNSKKLTVADALILIGFNPGQLIGRTGKSISFELNGVKKIVRGEYGKAAEIYVNGKTASLDTVLKAGDDITVIPAVDGADAEARLSDYVSGMKGFKVTLNGISFDAGAVAYCNGKAVREEYSINEGDSIIIHNISTVHDLMAMAEVSDSRIEIVVNGAVESPDYILRPNDAVEFRFKNDLPAAVQSKQEDACNNNGISVENENPIILQSEVSDDGGREEGLRVIINGKPVYLKGDKSQYIFVDIFNYIDFDLSKPQGNIALRLNGGNAAFTDGIKEGDVIDIYWEK